jgi:hypothetical protein
MEEDMTLSTFLETSNDMLAISPPMDAITFWSLTETSPYLARNSLSLAAEAMGWLTCLPKLLEYMVSSRTLAMII